MPLGNKPLPEPMLTQIYVSKCASLGLNELTHCDFVTPYVNINLGQYWSGNGLLLDDTKPLPEPMLTYHVDVTYMDDLK